VIYLWPRNKSTAPPVAIAPDFPLTTPPLPPPRIPSLSASSVLIIGYGASAQSLWLRRASLFAAARWACPLQYEPLLRSRGPAFLDGITCVPPAADVFQSMRIQAEII
jgi:hypothetical protein